MEHKRSEWTVEKMETKEDDDKKRIYVFVHLTRDFFSNRCNLIYSIEQNKKTSFFSSHVYEKIIENSSQPLKKGGEKNFNVPREFIVQP
jgi:hypothetical protein